MENKSGFEGHFSMSNHANMGKFLDFQTRKVTGQFSDAFWAKHSKTDYY